MHAHYFKPSIHLAFQPPKKVYTLNELNLSIPEAYSEFACTAPFPLLSKEGVEKIRSELFSEAIQNHCHFSSERTPSVLRGVCQYSRFIYDLWRSESIERCLSEALNYPIKPHPMDYELGHINIQIQSSHENVDDWHYDSYPFVCVLMLSDSQTMQGGELMILDGHNNQIPIKIPEAGWAVLLQGQYVKHCARKALNTPERITMVTSCIPANPMVTEYSTLAMSKNYSDLERLGYEWSSYRLGSLKEKINAMQSMLANEYSIDQALNFCDDLLNEVSRTKSEIVRNLKSTN